MNLIYYRGLNCHFACVVNIAASLDINYKDAFCSLWSETDFAYDSLYNIYLSKRVFPNLKALGAKMEILSCRSATEAEKSFLLIPKDEFFIVGMDTYHIPWNPVYLNFHGPHYFFAKKDDTDSLICFDPTYDEKNRRLTSQEALLRAFDFSRILKSKVTPQKICISDESREILRKHPETLMELLDEIKKCKNKQWKGITPLIRRITAMINNRYLFQRFLHQYPFATNREQLLFDEAFLLKWEAAKNGLYKASIIKKNESVIDEVCGLISDLFRDETDMAEKIILSEVDCRI